jgi:hypothetical protein
VGRISTKDVNQLLERIEQAILLNKVSEDYTYLYLLESLINEIRDHLEVLDSQNAKVLLEKIYIINDIIKSKSEEIIKILEDKQKEEKLVQEAKKLLSDLI